MRVVRHGWSDAVEPVGGGREPWSFAQRVLVAVKARENAVRVGDPTVGTTGAWR